MSVAEDLASKGKVIEQILLWGAFNQVIGALSGPALTELTQKVQGDHPVQVLSPPDLAEAVIRNYTDMASAAAEAAQSGMDAGRFTTMVHLAGDAPGPQQLVEALQRQIIEPEGTGPDSTSFAQGIREGRLADKWIPMFRALGHVILPPADVAHALNRSFLTQAEAEKKAAEAGVTPDLLAILSHLAGDAPAPGQLAEALRRGLVPRDGAGPDSTSFAQGIREGNLLDKWTDVVAGLAKQWPTPAVAAAATLKGQVTQAEGKALYERFGGDPQWWQLVFDTEGNAPTPVEAIGMALRGIIPWAGTGPDVTSYDQAFHEGPWRDKWRQAYEKSAFWWPTASEAITLLRYQEIDEKTALEWLKQRGMNDSQAAAWVGYARQNEITDYRGLTEQAVLEQVSLGYISDKQAEVMLAAVHKGPAAIRELLAYAHIQKAITSLGRTIDRIGTLYQTRKITKGTARSALAGVKLPATEIEPLLADWDAVASINVKTLTESQVADAWAYGILTQDEAMTELENIGYTPFDAWVVLSNKAKAPLPGKPARGPAAPLGTVTPGTT